MSESDPPRLVRLVRLWWQMTRGALILFVVIAAGLFIFNGDFRAHHLGFTDQREVTVVAMQEGTERCGRHLSGDLARVTWTADGATQSAGWTVCPGDGPAEPGSHATLWVADGRKAHDTAPWELYAYLPVMAVSVGTVLTAFVMLTRRTEAGR